MITERERRLMDDHKKDADVILDEEWQQQLPGNALYFIGVLVVCFVIVMLLLVAIAR
ncbi:MAG TPA: hypothetical protein VFN14_01390 [Candidatus Limnocylindria bacterium]|nr:hypothetical protein [Candidatus Limnocylindria bacterium]